MKDHKRHASPSLLEGEDKVAKKCNISNQSLAGAEIMNSHAKDPEVMQTCSDIKSEKVFMTSSQKVK